MSSLDFTSRDGLIRARGRACLAGLLVRRVLAAKAAVLAQLDPVGIVALGLLALVVAPLALLARECDGDSDVSASHRFQVMKKDPASARLGASLARPPFRSRPSRRRTGVTGSRIVGSLAPP